MRAAPTQAPALDLSVGSEVVNGRWFRWAGGAGLVLVAFATVAYLVDRAPGMLPITALVTALVVWTVGVIIVWNRAARERRGDDDDGAMGGQIPAFVLITGSRFRLHLLSTLAAITLLAGLRQHHYPDTIPEIQADNIRSWALIGIVATVALLLVSTAVRLLRLDYHVDQEVAGPDRLYRELYEQCYGMASYAIKRGYAADPTDLRNVSAASRYFDEQARLARRARRMGDTDEGPAAVGAVQRLDHQALGQTHQRLATLVAPAVPKTLQLLSYPNKDDPAPWLGPIRLTRMLSGLSLMLIPLFLMLAITVGTDIEANGLFPEDANGPANTITAFYLLVGSALGATFAALFKAFRYIEDLSYDDKHEPSYWVRWILGVVAGLILSIVIAQSGVFPRVNGDQAGFRLTVPLLAIAGGFSSDLVYRILERVVESISTLINGKADETEALVHKEAEMRAATQKLRSQADMVAQIVGLRATLPADADKADRKIDELLAKAVDADAASTLAVLEPTSGSEVAVDDQVVMEVLLEPASVTPVDVLASVIPPERGTLRRDGMSLSWTFTAREPGEARVLFAVAAAPTQADAIVIRVVDTPLSD